MVNVIIPCLVLLWKPADVLPVILSPSKGFIHNEYEPADSRVYDGIKLINKINVVWIQASSEG